MSLTQENYYEDNSYLSCSLYKQLAQCPAKGMAIKNDKYKYQTSKSMKLGSLVHAHVESPEAFEKMMEDKTLFKKDGELLASYKIAYKMIETIENDKLMQSVLQGRKEQILVGRIGGIKTKGKVDVLNEKFITDLKTARNLDPYWYLNYDYIAQSYFYVELHRQMYGVELPYYIAAVTSEDIPNKEVYIITKETIKEKEEEVLTNMEWIAPIFNGEVEPIGCGKCDYCRSIKELDFPIEL